MTILRHLLFALILVTVSCAALAAKININTASPTVLTQLDGVGPAKAEAIVQYREANGAFATVDDLTKVEGIGDKTLNANRDQITVK